MLFGGNDFHKNHQDPLTNQQDSIETYWIYRKTIFYENKLGSNKK